MDQTTLDTLQPGQRAEVLGIRGESDVRKRITEMGLTKGSTVVVERIAPLGDPMDLKVRGYRLSLRKDEAARISVRPIA